MLKINISSFSYKNGIPEDKTGNGGGFVFDCRGIENPGRYEKYKKLTGRDQEVIDFLLKNTEINNFLESVFSILSISLNNYLARGFTDLQISFGCTGGQHRSVYCADALEKWLRDKYKDNISVQLHHREQEKKNWNNG